MSEGDKFQEAMTAEEKQKLYDAIGYQEAGDAEYPKEVCHSPFCFNSAVKNKFIYCKMKSRWCILHILVRSTKLHLS